ncbi:MAG: helix-turn-helix transcriptional regulator [Rhizobacter sp.]|nr:helix-turn-helix transcriptional regulator [Chlorobiales bacterium]
MKASRSKVETFALNKSGFAGPHIDVKTEADMSVNFPPHKHNFFEIILFTAGGGTHQLATQAAEVKQGSLYFLLPHHIHRLAVSEHAKFYLVAFDFHFLRPEFDVDVLSLQPINLNQTPEFAPFLFQGQTDYTLNGERLRQTQSLLETLRNENRNLADRNIAGGASICRTEIMRASLMLLLGNVCRWHEKKITSFVRSGAATSTNDTHVARAMQFIRDHLHQSISLDDAAKHVFLSPTYFAHLLKNKTGKTFGELLTESRIEKASELLRYTSASVSEISHQIGFEDQAYFARRFKQQLGRTPRAFRTESAAFK